MNEDNIQPMLDAAGQDALARQWLGANVNGVDLFIETSDCTDHTRCPDFVRVRVDIQFLCDIQRRNAFCLADDMANLASQSTPLPVAAQVRTFVGMGAKDDVVDEWYLYADQSDFFLEGKADGEVLTSSQSILLSQLGPWLQGTPDAASLPAFGGEDNFRWYGGRLLYAVNDAVPFLENVLAKHPEIAARQLEIEMASRIHASGVVAPASHVRRQRNAL